MEFSTLEDIQKAFPDEESARKYLIELRWGKFASCPYCGNTKCYMIKERNRFKCADKKCAKKFAVISKTLMSASNVPLNKWVESVFLFAKKKNELKVWDIEKSTGLSKSSSLFLLDKLNFTKKFVLFDRANVSDIMKDVFQCFFNLYDNISYFKRHYHLKECSDISNVNHYNQAINYTKYWMRRSTWLDKCQFTPEDIIANVFIYMADNNIKEYDSDLVARLIRSVSFKMSTEWLKEHPNEKIIRDDYIANWQRRNRATVGDYYVRSRIKRTHPDKKATEIYADKKLISERREVIKKFRQKYHLLDGFNSHFS